VRTGLARLLLLQCVEQSTQKIFSALDAAASGAQSGTCSVVHLHLEVVQVGVRMVIESGSCAHRRGKNHDDCNKRVNHGSYRT
jgi:hypothetical protein